MKYHRLLLTLLLSGCMVGPNYHQPSAPMTARFKEMPGWSLAKPNDQASRGAWWSVYGDPALDRLEQQVQINNQNVLAAEAAVREAAAAVALARSQLFPTVAVGATPGTGAQGRTRSSAVQLEGSVSWEIDVWGRIRREIESARDLKQASEADLANAALSAQSQLASAYFELRATDALHDLLASTIVNYQRSLDITRHQYDAGMAAAADVVTAETFLSSTQASLINTGVTRTQLEHAIAVLIGKPPADFALAQAPWTQPIPPAPDVVPSSLLQRRPDIAAAERTMASQNASIGEAVAAFYPTISLSALYEATGNPVHGLFAVGNRMWSLGLAANETLFEGGARSAAVDQARATYDASVATYRQTVLTAFQQVEDDLSSLRILADQQQAEQRTVALATRSVALELNDYKAGTVAYTSVVTQQVAQLNAQQTALQVRENQFLSSVSLIAALGGGWQAP